MKCWNKRLEKRLRRLLKSATGPYGPSWHVPMWLDSKIESVHPILREAIEHMDNVVRNKPVDLQALCEAVGTVKNFLKMKAFW